MVKGVNPEGLERKKSARTSEKRTGKGAVEYDVAVDWQTVYDDEGTEIVDPNTLEMELKAAGKMSAEDIEARVEEQVQKYSAGTLVGGPEDLRQLLEKNKDLSKEEIDEIVDQEKDKNLARLQEEVDREMKIREIEEQQQVEEDLEVSEKLRRTAEEIAEQGILSPEQAEKAIAMLEKDVSKSEWNQLGVESFGISHKEYKDVLENYAALEARIEDAQETMQSLGGSGIAGIFKRMPLIGNREYRKAKLVASALAPKMRRYNHVLEVVTEAIANQKAMELSKQEEEFEFPAGEGRDTRGRETIAKVQERDRESSPKIEGIG